MSSAVRTDFPELPAINGDLILETFSHKSLTMGYDPEKSFDNERLAVLGDSVLQTAVTTYLYKKRPIVTAKDMFKFRNTLLSEDNYKIWVEHYRLYQRLRYMHSDDLKIHTPEETKTLFHAYVGAVYIYTHTGPITALNWITMLLDPEAEIIRVPVDNKTADVDDSPRLGKRPRKESSPLETISPLPTASELPPANPTMSTTIVGSSAHYEVPHVFPATSNVVPLPPPPPIVKTFAYLPIFNQMCAQRKLKLEYLAENQGTAHEPIWLTTCRVNEIEKGRGRGRSKQASKEEAARNAYFAMGWGGYSY